MAEADGCCVAGRIARHSSAAAAARPGGGRAISIVSDDSARPFGAVHEVGERHAS